LAPGSTGATGKLTVTGNTTLGGNTVIKLNDTGSPTSDELVCVSVTASGSLTVTNIGPALAAGTIFQLFSTAATGFAPVNLPVSDNNYRYTWNNKLSDNGTIVLSSATLLVNTNPAPITKTFNGTSLTLSWPADHTGWRLQVQTNPPTVGLGNNWVTVPGSTNTDTETFSVNPGNGAVFYRLVYP
jgi:hypothetical protein